VARSVQLVSEGEGAGASVLVLTNAAAGEHSVKIDPYMVLPKADVCIASSWARPGNLRAPPVVPGCAGEPTRIDCPDQSDAARREVRWRDLLGRREVPCIKARRATTSKTVHPEGVQSRRQVGDLERALHVHAK